MTSSIEVYNFVWWHLPLWIAAYGLWWMFWSWLGAEACRSR